MRKYIIFLTVVLYSCVATYPFSKGFPDPKFEKIIETNYSTDNAFVMANSWLVEKMTNAKDVIQYSDKEAGIIKGKFYLHYNTQPDIVDEVSGLITINLKDNKAKIQIEVSANRRVAIVGNYDQWSETELQKYKAKVDYLLSDFERIMTTEINTEW